MLDILVFEIVNNSDGRGTSSQQKWIKRQTELKWGDEGGIIKQCSLFAHLQKHFSQLKSQTLSCKLYVRSAAM